jgi:hypothetical protein
LPWPRWTAAFSVLVLVTLTFVAIHLRASAEKALAESDQALASGDTVTAIERARDAAMSLAPFSPSEGGYARLRSIAQAAEAHGNFDVATMAWRATWTAIRATRSEGREQALLAEAGRGLVRVATRACEAGQTRSPASCASAVEATLAPDDLPPLTSFAWLGMGALAFLGGGAVAAQATSPRRRFSSLLVMGSGLLLVMLAMLTR